MGLKIYGFGTQNNGCAKYRIWQPLEVLSRLGMAEVRREPDEPGSISAERADDVFRWADVVVCQPFSELWAASIFLSARDVHRKKLVVDLDDDIYAVHPLNLGIQNDQLFHLVSRFAGGFNDYWEIEEIPEGRKEEFAKRLDGTVFNQGGTWKFVRSKAPDCKLVATTMLEHADLVTTTNEHLAGVFRQHTKAPISVLPNCLDPKEWKNTRRKKHDLTLGWAGSMSHYPDLKPLMPALDSVMESHPELKLHIMGSSFDYLFPLKPGAKREAISGYDGADKMFHAKLEDCGQRYPGRMSFDPPVTIQKYTKWFRSKFTADIAIAPILDNEFNKAKSELKWLENAALGIPTVASKVGPYERAIRHGEDGLLCGSNGAWTKAINSLVEDESLRKKIGKAANDRLWAEYDAEKRAPEWLKAYEWIV